MANNFKFLFEDWEDDNRMRALFADFRPKNVNPEGWRNKMNTWVSVIISWCKQNRSVVISVKDLANACERKGEYPRCLEQVLLHMLREGTLTLKENALSAPANQGWIGWSMNLLVKQPISWGWKTVNNFVYGSTDTASTQKYVHTSLLKEISSTVLQRLEDELDFDTPTMSLTQCRTICRELCDEESFSLVVSHLQSQQKLTVFTESGTQYIKLHRKTEEKAAVTETDVGFVRLQKTLQKVDAEIDKLRKDIQSCTEQAKVAMKSGQKTKVQSLLRRKKNIEKIVEQKMKTVEQLEGMIHKLQSTSSNQEVFGALKAGLDAQKKISAKGFNIDVVENTMDDIKDVFGEQTEIEHAMSTPGLILDSEEDSALEEELDELLKEQQKKQTPKTLLRHDESTKDLIFPDVPVANPSPPKMPSKSSMMEQL